MNKLVILFIASISFCISGCKKDSLCNCLESTGGEITEVRSLPNFSTIEMSNNVDVVLHTDTFFSVSVTCGKNLIDGIQTKVEDQRLFISNINKCNWLRDFKNRFVVTITAPSFDQITNTGSGNLYCADTIAQTEFQIDNWSGTGEMNLLLHCNEVRFKLHTGPADINASGVATTSYVYSAGNGFFRGSELLTEYCYVTTKSTGDCDVFATKELGVTIEYQGDVYYKGNPDQINSTITGSGKLIAR